MKALLLFLLLGMNFAVYCQFSGGTGTAGDPYQIATGAQFYAMRSYSYAYFIQTANISLAAYSSGSGWVPDFAPQSYNGNGFKITGLVINRPTEDFIGLFSDSVTEIKNVILENCSVTGDYYVGGLLGQNRGTVSNCFVSGTVNGNRYCGGLIGNSRFDYAPVSNCHSSCSVYGEMYIGGLVGYLRELSSVVNCYSKGAVSTSWGPYGGLIGSSTDGVVTNSFWDTETSGMATSWGGTGLTSAEMKNCVNFYNAGWNFTSIWGMNETQNGGYPFLRIQGFVHNIFGGGDGSPGSPWLISTPYHLNNVRYYKSAIDDFLQTDDIDLSGYTSGSGWDPIGDAAFEFLGTYEGGGHKITGLYVNRPALQGAGLFGALRLATVLGVIIEDCNITGYDCTGALAGSTTDDVTIGRCSTSGSVTGNDNTGGLIGYSRASLFQCSSGVVVEGNDFVGGLIGQTDLGRVENSYASGSVSGRNVIGGLVGYCRFLRVNKTYSSCLISGSDILGGLIAEAVESEVTNSFWDAETSGVVTSAGGDMSDTRSMQDVVTYTSLKKLLEYPWDFAGDPYEDKESEDYWNIDPLFNGGYPFLQSEQFVSVPVITSATSVGSDFVISWSAVTGAVSYKVYSSNEPFGTYVEDNTGSFNGCQWSIPYNLSKAFYKVTAVNNFKK